MSTGRPPLLLCLAMAGALASSSPSRDQQPVFRSGVDAVRVDVLVTDRGQPVVGLTAADFDVTDNGVPQRVELTTTAAGADVVLALDTSSSVAGERLRRLKDASRMLVRSLAPDDTVTLLSFSDRLTLFAGRDFAVIANSLEGLEGAGRTAVRDAVFTAASLAPHGRRSVLIVFTDGSDNSSWLSEAAVLEAIGRLEVVVYAVADSALEPRARSFMQNLTDVGGGELLFIGHSDLARTFTRVLDQFRARYLLSYTPTGVGRDDGWHRVGVKLRRKNGRVKSRPGYFAAIGQSSR